LQQALGRQLLLLDGVSFDHEVGSLELVEVICKKNGTTDYHDVEHLLTDLTANGRLVFKVFITLFCE
jgi:hypothetical protein